MNVRPRRRVEAILAEVEPVLAGQQRPVPVPPLVEPGGEATVRDEVDGLQAGQVQVEEGDVEGPGLEVVERMPADQQRSGNHSTAG